MQKRIILLLLLCAALLCGCGGESAGPAAPPGAGQNAGQNAAAPTQAAQPTQAVKSRPAYQTPPFLDAVYHPELAEGEGDVKIDVSAVSEGYVAVSAVAESRLKFQIRYGEETYTYDLERDGTPSVFPLSCGDGEYHFRVMENVTESRYAEIASLGCTVTMQDEFQPFLRPSDYVHYGSGSACVKKAAELASQAGTVNEVITLIYEFVSGNIRYDQDKAAVVQSGYVADPDEVLQSGRGICFDFASLAAAMLRSQGVPTKMIFGYVSPDGLYHAWNMFYTAETGWVTVQFTTGPDGWTRMDATFAAGGATAEFIGDGSNYLDLYCY